MADDTRVPVDWETGSVDSDGVGIRYLRTGGDGPPLVIAHGITDDALTRLPLVRDLQREYDVIAYDARGHGLSDAPEEGYAVDDLVSDLLAVVDGLDIRDPILFGHSLGGNTVAAAAARRPDLPRAVVLEDPAGMLVYGGDDPVEEDGDDASREELVANERERIEGWNESSVEELLETEPEMAGYVSEGRRELAELLAEARQRVDPNAARIYGAGVAPPTAVYPGVEAAALILKADAEDAEREGDREVADLLPDGDLVHVEGAGHTVFRDRYDDAYRELLAFLDDV